MGKLGDCAAKAWRFALAAALVVTLAPLPAQAQEGGEADASAASEPDGSSPQASADASDAPAEPSTEGLEGYVEGDLATEEGLYDLEEGAPIEDEGAEGAAVALATGSEQASAKLDAWIKENLTAGMTPYQKMLKACAWSASQTYDSNHNSWQDLVLYNAGTCWSGSYFMEEVGKRIGVECRTRNAERDVFAASSSHRDAIARFSNGSYTVFDATPGFGAYWDENPPYIASGNTIRQYDGFAKNVVIPSAINGTTITELEGEALMRSSIATLIEQVSIPATITSIGDNCFAGLMSCTAYNVDAANPAYKSVDGVLYTKDGKTLVAYPQGRASASFSVPSGVTAIASGAFTNARKLASVTIPSTVKSIGAYAFQDCRSLASVTIPEGVAEIRVQTFMKCPLLTAISFPSSVKVIEHDAFMMTGIRKVVLPKTVERVADGAFSSMLGEYSGGGIDEAYVYNPRAVLEGNPFFLCTVYGYKGSTAQAYAEYAGLTFKDIAASATPSVVWNRLSGPVALDTMAAITEQGFAGGSCDSVVVATMDGYWDALTASGLAGLRGCPILLTDGDSLSLQAYDQIRRLDVKTVYLAGGTAAVSKAVERDIQSLGPKTVRLAGATAVDTALKIYEHGKGSWSKTAVIATSATFQDALSASPFAYARRAPVFLANATTKKLDEKVRSAIVKGGFTEVLICGGPAAISTAVEKQLPGVTCVRKGGDTCYETSSAIASYCISKGMTPNVVGVATGESYYDALAGAALCGKSSSAIVLVSDGNRSAIDSFVKPNSAKITAGFVFGGSAAVSDATFSALVKAAPGV